jgi:hypothetical protein
MLKLARRFVAALSAVWVMVALVEPPGLYVCPMHSMPAHAGHKADAPAAHHHHEGAGATSNATTPDNSNHHGKDCRCISDCLGGVAVAVVPSTPSFEFATTVEVASFVPSSTSAPADNVGLLLPHANAPPSLS